MADAKPERLTLGEALKDFGFFSILFAVTVSGPSVLSLLQAVFVDHKLVDALQWIVDGYNRIVGVLGAIVEPLVQAAVDWVNASLGWRLHLEPHWRPTFLLLMTVVMSDLRVGSRKLRTLIAVIAALVAAIAAGVLPQDGPWYVPGFAASVPLAVFWLGFGVAGAVNAMSWVGVRNDLLEGANGALLWGGCAFLAAVASANIAANGAGILGLTAAIAIIGYVQFAKAFSPRLTDSRGAKFFARLGLTMLGGFMVAALVMTADTVLKAVGFQ